MMSGLDHEAKWHHIIIAIVIIVGIAFLFSLESGKPIDTESVSVDATSVLILGG